MAGTIAGERGGLNGAEGALIHTYVRFEDGTEVTVSSSYHETEPKGNSTFVFETREPFYGLLIAGPIREYHTTKHAETLLEVLKASSIEELRATLPASDTEEFTEARETVEAAPDFEGLLKELAAVLGTTGEEVID